MGSTAIKQQANFTLVRPLVEYVSSVWNPYTQGNIQKVEMVQRRAARYVTNRNWNISSVSGMLQDLKWRTLQDRRKDAHLCMLYRIDREFVAIWKDRRLIPPRRRTRKVHNRTFQTISCRTDRRDDFLPTDGSGLECLITGYTRGELPLCLQGQGVCKEPEDVLL